MNKSLIVSVIREGEDTPALALIASPRVSIFTIPRFLDFGDERRGSRRMMKLDWTMNRDGRRGAVRVVVGSWSSPFQASRKNNRGLNALRIVTDILANDEVSKRVVLRLFDGVVEGISPMVVPRNRMDPHK